MSAVQFIGITTDVPAALWDDLILTTGPFRDDIKDRMAEQVLARVADNGYQPLGTVQFHDPIYYRFTGTDDEPSIEVTDPYNAQFVRLAAEVLSAKD